jgi:hypothetical protein
VPDSELKAFTGEADAKKYAQEKKDVFDRVALLRMDDEGPKLIERYSDGRYEKAEDIVRR